ncbi:MAG: 2-succinyl-5-enolpyruvyl-6-hydroxy-3-cyclohexene-1-carboxylate synthase [Chlamydiae bacterium]|nr:2-succinyl-5-enolpyruvyl-6-hydroxy-3-cyclohexene-1-carboxylate synthase [Chlamydiota bacterium]
MNLIDALIQQKVTFFCLSPGNRSTPLALALAENPLAKTFVHYDERGAAFHALGYAKATKKPAAIVVTSGTAVGNLMPAVMEADAAHIPLILLTCDRPPNLRDTMANQTTDQTKIFGNFVRYFFDLPSDASFISSTAARAVSASQYPLPGPVQLNCPFAEPFSEQTPSSEVSTPIEWTFPEITLKDPKPIADQLQQIEKGVIVVGANGGTTHLKALSQKLGWPILPDIVSSYRHLADERTIPYYPHALKAHSHLKADAVLYFGDACVSKTLLKWMSLQHPLIHVATHAKRCDPFHAVTKRIVCSPEQFCKQVTPLIDQKQQEWFCAWKEWSEHSAPKIETKTLSEPAVTKVIQQFAGEGTALFFGNSMPIRDAEEFFFPETPCGPIFANRGLSGIDGNIATIAGIAQVMPVVAAIGDQTALHDLNSLSQLSKTKHPVKLVIINNGGGGIFSFASHVKRLDILDSHFAAAHTLTFEKAAELFRIPYEKIEKIDQLLERLHSRESCIMEVTTDRRENFAQHQEIDKRACSSFSMAF